MAASPVMAVGCRSSASCWSMKRGCAEPSSIFLVDPLWFQPSLGCSGSRLRNPSRAEPPPPRRRFAREGEAGLCSDRLRQPKKEAAARAELRRPDANAGAASDLIGLIEQVDH